MPNERAINLDGPLVPVERPKRKANALTVDDYDRAERKAAIARAAARTGAACDPTSNVYRLAIEYAPLQETFTAWRAEMADLLAKRVAKEIEQTIEEVLYGKGSDCGRPK